MTLELTFERCVRTRSVAASCRTCVDICPTESVSLGGPRQSVEVALDTCIECGLCQAACPTDAFQGVFDTAAFVASRPREVSCGRGGLPCVGALSSEELLTLAMAWGSLKVIARDCAAGNTGHERVRLAVEKARVFARAMGADVALEWRDETSLPKPGEAKSRRPSPGRRQLLGLLVPKASPRKLKSPERLDVAAIRAVGPTARRQRFLATLPPTARPVVASLPGESVACLSTKKIDRSSCTACMSCVTSCPTGALVTARLNQEIRFEARRCVNCHLCHDVCDPKAITADAELNLVDFLDPNPKVLVSFQMTLCGECGAPFRAERDDQVMCAACRDRQTEAKTLWGHR